MDAYLPHSTSVSLSLSSPRHRFHRLRAARAPAPAVCALAIPLLLGGCILTTDLPDPALTIPGRYQSAGAKAQAAPPALDWWRGFRSAELTRLMEEAQVINLDIAAATARFRQADALARQAGAPLFPSIFADASAAQSRSSGASSSASTSGGRTFNQFSVSLSASYEIDFWGKNRAAALAADEAAIASRFDRDVVALVTLAGVANAYFQVLASQDRIRIANNNIASAQRIYDAFKERLKVGTATDLDVAQQESTLENQRAALPLLRLTLAESTNALAVLLARPPEALRVKGGSLRQMALPRVTPGIPSELLTQRPDIRRAEAQLASATANVGNARAQFFPSIQLTGQGGYQSAALSALFSPQAAFYNVAAGLTQPIFDGFRIQSNFELQKARQDELLQTYRQTVVSSFADVNDALVAIRQSNERLRALNQVVASSRRAFELAEQRLAAGTADTTTVLNVQLTLFQAEDSLALARLARLQAIVALYQALGGGWALTAKGPLDAI
ncbi:efflux transporter outer membrane subunit [Bradyrhizobium sp. LHD-71]|uniref:efflux transporter outer membrane subunit n=1 Tax=Bradyrhizobium sp. LHD-71 TaxID=3072141 RepID=UPI00280C9CBC|nr:efflux transporter outer membrane subunit [Bradyrhizobium sp. LHD-71]MDQ8730110.1 efflux transporter outer membrane subunit [Bradyrhizobium sp. LHD-71]